MRINDKSKREKETIRQQLRERDGDGTRKGTKCFIDGCMTEEQYRKETGKDFDICHLDDNPSNWNWQNIFLGTHKCNCQMTPHGKIDHKARFLALSKSLKLQKMRSLLTHIQADESEGLRVRSAEYMKSAMCKPLMEEELERILDLKKEEEKNELIDSLSNASSLAPEVCRKWLRTWCNGNNGHLEEFPKEVKGDTKTFIRRKAQ